MEAQVARAGATTTAKQKWRNTSGHIFHTDLGAFIVLGAAETPHGMFKVSEKVVRIHKYCCFIEIRGEQAQPFLVAPELDLVKTKLWR